MVIRFRPHFSQVTFERGKYMPESEWLHLLLRAAATSQELYTDKLYDLVCVGRKISDGTISPIQITVLLNGGQYLYGPEGDLYRVGKTGSGPEVIRLSRYKSI